MTSVTSLPLLKILKSCLPQKAFGRTSYQPKQMHECGENIAWERGRLQTVEWEENERQGQSENLTMRGVRGQYAGEVETFSLTLFQQKN